MKITRVHGREILDSRGNPTVEVDVTLDGGVLGRAAVPSGASTGEREALELRDGDKTRYSGKGVRKAVANVNGEIAKALVGQSLDQRALDTAMIALDGTPTKARLGANAILGVSMAALRAEALSKKLPLYQHIGALYSNTRFYVLPVPMMNILNGGAHADSSVDFQEFMVMPVGAPSFAEAVRTGAEIFHALRGILKGRGQIDRCRRRRRLRAQPQVEPRGGGRGAGSDRQGRFQGRAATCSSRSTSRRANSGQAAADTSSRSPANPIARQRRWWSSTQTGSGSTRSSPSRTASPRATGKAGSCSPAPVGDSVQLVGDDVFVTNPEILKRGIADKVANGLLVKLNQIGTVTETLDAVKMARDASYTTIMSHRSGETEDATIADMAVGTAAGQIKTGSASRTDRLCKYNQLLRIEEELGSAAVYAGRSAIHALSARK